MVRLTQLLPTCCCTASTRGYHCSRPHLVLVVLLDLRGQYFRSVAILDPDFGQCWQVKSLVDQGVDHNQ